VTELAKVCGVGTECVHEAMLLGWPSQNSCWWKMTTLWEKDYGVGCSIWCIWGMVFHETSNAGLIVHETMSRSRSWWFARFS
jgi:hypothetical protein